jgi:DNA-binding NarL/FixJ family response regulator
MFDLNILLIDDHALFRSGLSLIIKMAMPSVVVSEAGCIDDALGCELGRVDLVLLDVQLNGKSGLEYVGFLKQKWPLAPILVVSSQDEPEMRRFAQACGTAGFISKAETASQIVAKINSIVSQSLGVESAPPQAIDYRQLTPRQGEVLGLLHKGLSNKLIARELLLSENTVRRHVQAILEFFGMSSRAEAVYAALCQGLLG